MITIAQAKPVYDFEGVFQPAIAAVFVLYGLTCATPSTITQFQSVRPRIELMMRYAGAIPKGQGGQRVIIDTLGNVRDAAHRGELNITVLTDAGEADKVVHSQTRALVRAVAMSLPLLVNNTEIAQPNNAQSVAGLVNHKLNFIQHTGDTWQLKNADGYWQTGMTFAIEFSIQSTALQQLGAT
jgi:hypothetical protein